MFVCVIRKRYEIRIRQLKSFHLQCPTTISAEKGGEREKSEERGEGGTYHPSG